MKKLWIACMSLGLSLGLVTTTAFASPGMNHGKHSNTALHSGVKDKSSFTQKQGNSGTDGQSGAQTTVTSATYGNSGAKGHQGYKGLENAWLHVQGKSAQAQVESLLNDNYNISDLVNVLDEQSTATTASTKPSTTDDKSSNSDNTSTSPSTNTSDNTSTSTSTSTTGNTSSTADSSSTVNNTAASDSTNSMHPMSKQEIKQIAEQLKAKYQANPALEKAQVKAMAKLTNVLETSGSLDDAVDIQKDVVKNDVQNMSAYIKLGQLLKKQGKHGIKAYVNGATLQSSVPPVIKNGTTLVPFRAISEALKAKVSWDGSSQTVTVSRNGITVKLTIGSKVAYVNGQAVQLDQPAQVTNGRTLIPARFVSQALKAAVKWDGSTESVVIYDTSASSNTSDAAETPDNTSTTDQSSSTTQAETQTTAS